MEAPFPDKDGQVFRALLDTETSGLLQDLLSQFNLTNDLASLVYKANYAGILKYVKSQPKGSVNYELAMGPPSTSFTGLEWAIYRSDWKMAALFFVFDASPKLNCFEGVIHTHASFNGVGDPIIIDGFDGDDPKPIPGFVGLRLLVGDEENGGKALLWLMETIHSAPLTLGHDYGNIVRSVDVISEDLQRSGSDFRALVMNTLLYMKKLGMPNDVAVKIAEYAVLETLWLWINEFALRGLDDEDSALVATRSEAETGSGEGDSSL